MQDITTDEALNLIKMPKTFVDVKPIVVRNGEQIQRGLRATETRETFTFTLSRGPAGRFKMKIQKRDSSNTPLVRLELGSHVATHRNPDGAIIRGSHLHIYREGYRDAFAVPLNEHDAFSDTLDVGVAYGEFCMFCMIQDPPNIQRTLE